MWALCRQILSSSWSHDWWVPSGPQQATSYYFSQRKQTLIICAIANARYGSRSFKSTKELFPLSLSRSVFRILCSYCIHVFVIYWGGFTKSWVLWVAHSDSQWVREVKLYSGSHVFVLNSWELTHLSFMKYAVFLFWATGESGISNLKTKWWISRYMCDY